MKVIVRYAYSRDLVSDDTYENATVSFPGEWVTVLQGEGPDTPSIYTYYRASRVVKVEESPDSEVLS